MDYRPDVFLINDLNSANDRNLVADEIYVINNENGTIVNNRRMRGTFISILELHSFPFDMHTLKVQLVFSDRESRGKTCAPRTSWRCCRCLTS